MSNTLTNFFISDTYTGLLHAFGSPIPGTGRAAIYDGSGTQTALSLGIINNGATISGGLTVGTLAYPAIGVANGAIVVQTSSTSLGLVTSLPGTILDNITAGAGGVTYNNINTITITPEGLVSKVTELNDVNTITRTTYSPDNTDNSIGQFTVTANNWVTVLLPSFFSDAKAGIFFIEPADSNKTLLADEQFNNIMVSPDQVKKFRVLTIIGLDGPSDLKAACSSQFSTLIGTNGGNKVIYFRRTGPNDFGSPANKLTFNLYYIAKQL
jgi:hypothetical protein